MKRKMILVLITVVFIITIIPIEASINISTNNEKSISNIYDCIYNGRLEERNGIKILHLNGSYYEMGYQHGFLLKDDIHAVFNAFLNWATEKGFSYEDILQKWNIMKPLLPECYIDEMKGVADASGLSLENISVLNVGFYLIINCGSFAAWGTATKDGKLLHVRSHDLPIKIMDPNSGTYLVETQVLFIREPDGFYSSISPSEPGIVSVSDGFNENEIAVGMLSSWTNDETFKGIGVGFRIRMILDTTSSIDEAIDILISNKTLGYNFIVSDAKIPIGYAVENTANISYVGTWNSTSESIAPFWEIENVVRRANLFVDTKTAETQRKQYHPGKFPIFSIILNLNKMSGTSISAARTWVHFTAISKGIESELGNLDLNKTMTILRDIYLGKTDFRFFFMQLLRAYSTPYQWVMCPENGDFVLSFATRDKNAFNNPVHYFNFYELLEENS
jgi:hypothetical protein